jgi:hypothetical protein
VSKFANRKVTIDGITFDSQKEARRWGELKLMERAGLITDLTLQPVFPIVVNGQKICKYIGDFSYYEGDPAVHVVEDVKSEFTRKLPVYRLKNKLLKAVHGVEIREV